MHIYKHVLINLQQNFNDSKFVDLLILIYWSIELIDWIDCGCLSLQIFIDVWECFCIGRIIYNLLKIWDRTSYELNFLKFLEALIDTFEQNI